VEQTNLSVEIIPEIAIRYLSDFDGNSVISFRIEISQCLNDLSTLFHTPNVAQNNFSVEIIPANRKTQSFRFRRNLCYFVPVWNISALNALSTPFYTPDVAQTKFSVVIIAENRKSQSFRFRRKLCYFVPDWDISASKRSFHSILHAECRTNQFHRRNNPWNRKTLTFQISTKSLLFRSWKRYFGVRTLFPLYFIRRT
jgi:hypothetical protein